MSMVDKPRLSDAVAAAIDESRLWATHIALASIGATPAGGVCRLALSADDGAARSLITAWARERRWSVFVDPIGNLFVRRDGQDPSLPPVVIGSHLDTQPTGGRFDGVYGVLAGIEVLRALDDVHMGTRRAIEVAAWTNEEGCRFSPGMMGSEAFAGIRPLEEMLALQDGNGITVAEALASTLNATPDAIRRPLGFPIHAYVEAHIEQGPELERTGNTIGVVTGIQGTCRMRVEVRGDEAHAGTTRRGQRRDALLAAARMIHAIERHVEACDPTDDVRLTFGMIKVKPNVPSVVASWAYFSIDVRHADDEVMLGVVARIEPICREHAGGCDVTVTEIQQALATRFEGTAFDSVLAAVRSLGYRYIEIPSGAGHDARQMARVCPSAMVFVPCAGGVSHNEAESAEPADLAAGTRVLAHAVKQLANT
jgi:beta-ureidopropionase / N-carbamoyl-L-amino-acid hydrolase